MGKMRIGSAGQQVAPTFKKEEQVVSPAMQRTINEIMEKCAETFKRVAEAEAREKQKPLTTMILDKPCACSKAPPLPRMHDQWARKHTVLLKEELIADRKVLEDLLVMYAQSTDKKLQELRSDQESLDGKFELLLDIKPEEKQVVTATVVEKRVIDKRIWLAIGASTLLNLILLLLK